jgi:hypothetical protein
MQNVSTTGTIVREEWAASKHRIGWRGLPSDTEHDDGSWANITAGVLPANAEWTTSPEP